MIKDKTTNGQNVSPKDQEVFETTNWKNIEEPKTQKKCLTKSWYIVFREVNIDKKVSKTTNEKNLVSNFSSHKPLSDKDYTERVGNHYGIPKVTPDPDPYSSCVKFQNLESIQAIRSDNNALNISFDTEFYYTDADKKHRIILSYQFAFYNPKNQNMIVEVCFIRKNDFDKDYRLTFAECLSVILDLPYFESVKIPFASTRKGWIRVIKKSLSAVEGDCIKAEDEEELIKGLNASSDEQFLKEVDKVVAKYNSLGDNMMCVIDRSNDNKGVGKQWYHDFSSSRKYACKIQIVSHFGIADLTAFKQDGYNFTGATKTICEYVISVQGGLVSPEDYYMHIPSYQKYWEFIPCLVIFRDTMCLAPAGQKKLTDLGKILEIPKIKLPEGVISDMKNYLITNPSDFIAYAAQDALVTLMYGSKILGINKSWIMTGTSGAAKAMVKNCAKYLNCITDMGFVDIEQFDKVFRGVEKVVVSREKTRYGMRDVSEVRHFDGDCQTLASLSKKCYSGGYNASFEIGLYNQYFMSDFDLKNAYPVGMCLTWDVDYLNPIKWHRSDFELTLDILGDVRNPFFCYCDFEFPKSVKYPCIGQNINGSLIFTRTGQNVYATGIELYLALQLGAKITVGDGIMCNVLKNADGSPSMCLRNACKQFVSDRMYAQKQWGKKSIFAELLKTFINGSYGKISQDVINKCNWDTWDKEMKDIGYSSVTCPEKAAYITAFVRCMLLGCMNQLYEMGYHVWSVTTDGFISDCDLDTLNALDGYGICGLFKESRAFLDNDLNATCWEAKHHQSLLLNITTRGNIGYGVSDKVKDCDEDTYKNLGVLAHNSYVSDFDKDSDEDRFDFFKSVLQREGRLTCYTSEFNNIRNIIQAYMKNDKEQSDFYMHSQKRCISMDFDLKRKPIKESFIGVKDNPIVFDNFLKEGDSFIKQGSSSFNFDYEIANFDTMPFENREEYEKFKTVKNNCGCLRTVENWESFYLKLNSFNSTNSCKRKNLKDLEWAKLVSIAIGYRHNIIKIPCLDGKSVKDIVTIFNRYNDSKRSFSESTWKNARRPERLCQMLPQESYQRLLDRFYNDCAA